MGGCHGPIHRPWPRTTISGKKFLGGEDGQCRSPPGCNRRLNANSIIHLARMACVALHPLPSKLVLATISGGRGMAQVQRWEGEGCGWAEAGGSLMLVW